MTLVSDPRRLITLLKAGVPLDGLVTDSAIPPTELRQLLDFDINGPTIYLASGPADPGIAEVRSHGGLVWAFDAAAVSALAYASASDGESLVAPRELLTAAASAQVIVQGPGGPAPLDEALAATWRALAAAARVCTGALPQALHWAFGVFAVAAANPVKPTDYDRFAAANPYALRLTESPAYAREIAHATSGACAAAWLDIATAFEGLLVAAAAAPKMPEVASWVTEAAGAGPPAAILVKSATAAAALRTALLEHPRVPLDADTVVPVMSLRDLATAPAKAPTRRLLLTGPLPREAAAVLALPPGSELTVLAAGPWEAARIVRQVSTVRAELAELRAVTHSSADELMSPAAADGSAAPEPTLIVDGNVAPLPVDDEGNAFEPFDLDVIAELRAVLTRGPERDVDYIPPARSEGQTTISALRIEFADGVLFASPYDLIDIRDGREVRRVAAKALRPGDDVVLVASSARRALFDAITESLATVPSYAPVAQRLHFWRSRLRRIPATGLTYQQVLDRMTGTSLTSWSTIYSWYRGAVQGPADPNDVARFAAALGDIELADAAGHVATALATMRRIHGKIGRWLSDQLAEVQGGHTDVLIDPDLSIYVSDLLEAVTMHRVVSVTADLLAVPAPHCGVLLPVVSAAAYPPAAPAGPASAMTSDEPIAH
jgi:hypothetical protein